MTVPSLTQRTAHGAAWMLGGAGLQSVLSLLVTIVLARLLGPAEFGQVGAGMIVIGLAQIFGQLGVGPAVVQRQGLTQRHIHAAFTIALMMGFLMAAVISMSAQLISVFFRMPNLAEIVSALALAFPITASATVANALLQRAMQYRTVAALELSSYLVGYGLVGIVAAVSGFGVWALVMAHLSQCAVASLSALYLQRGTPVLFLGLAQVKDLLRFGSGISIARLANYVAVQSDNLVVGRWLGAEALGAYARAYQFTMVPTNLLGSVADKVLFPVMSSVQSDDDRLWRGFTQASALVAMIALPAGAVIFSLAPELVLVILGPAWRDVALPLQILSVVLVFRAGYKICHTHARAKGAVFRTAWRQIVYAVAVLLGAWAGAAWGLGGVAAGVALAIVLNYTLSMHLSMSLTTGSVSVLIESHARHATTTCLVLAAVLTVKNVMLSTYSAQPLAIVVGGSGAAALTWGVAMLLKPELGGPELSLFIKLLRRVGRQS